MDLTARMAQIKKLHLDSFDWKAERIPFGIWVNDTRKYKEISYDDVDFDKKLFERQMQIVEDTVKLGSDLIPTLGITNYGIAVVPSIFGAEIQSSSPDVDQIENMGYWIKKSMDDIDDIDKYSNLSIESEFLTGVIKHIEYYRDNKPDHVMISNSLDGPFSVAEVLRGSDFYYDLYDKPDSAHRFLELCTDAVIRCEKEIRAAAGYSREVDEFPTYFGIWAPGLRFGDDSIINLSGEMINQFVVPCYRKIAESFKCKVEVHFCSVQKPIGEQVLKAFTDSRDIFGISSQFGADLYIRYHDIIKGKLSVEAGYGEALNHHAAQHGSFKKWAQYLKDHFHGNSGLILYTTVDAMEKGEWLLDDWNEVWQ